MTIAQRIKAIQQAISDTSACSQRAPQSIQLLAVSKGQPVAAIREAYHAGITNFAENYWQEAQPKLLALHDLPLTWHFIGPLQSNKAAAIAAHFAWVHSIDRLKIAQLLAQHRAATQTPLNVCIQINLDDERSKSGITLDKAPELVNAITRLPTLALRGFMAIPKPDSDTSKQYDSFARLASLLAAINQSQALHLDTLSMGMSDDWPAAIRAGSTMIRIGRAIFGERS